MTTVQVSDTTEHSVLPPSGADIWVYCAANPLRVASLFGPLPENPDHIAASNEGTASHWAMAEIAADRVVAEGQITDDGHVLLQPMIDGAQMLVDDVARTLPRIPRSEWHVEQRVKMPMVHMKCWGTPDCWVYDPVTHTIYVWDYKFGYGLVEVFENWQLILYLAGIMLALGIKDDIGVKVVFTIVQPRAFHPKGPIRRWTVRSAANLRGYWNRLAMAAEDAMSGFAKAVPNKNCCYCEARHVCQELQRDAYRSADLAEQSVPLLMSPAAVGTELSFLQDALKKLEARVEGLSVQAEDLIRKGHQVPGWGLENAVGRSAWDDSKIPLMKMTFTAMGMNPCKEVPLTPTQMRDSGADQALIAAFVAPSKTVRKLVRSDESAGRRMFGDF